VWKSALKQLEVLRPAWGVILVGNDNFCFPLDGRHEQPKLAEIIK